MKKEILKKRLKGLLAFTLAFILVSGSGITVLAKDWTKGGLRSLSQGEKISKGDRIIYSSGAVYIDDELKGEHTGAYSVQADLEFDRYVDPYQSPTYDPLTVYWAVYLKTVSSGSTNSNGVAPDSAMPQSEKGAGHTHFFEWKITREPDENQDGLSQSICACGYVEATQPIDRAGALIIKLIEEIKKAPANGSVTVDSWYLRCLTDEVMEALIARPDVTLNIEFEDKGVSYKVTIPAGMAPTDDQQFYGYYYLGSLYGWQQ